MGGQPDEPGDGGEPTVRDKWEQLNRLNHRLAMAAASSAELVAELNHKNVALHEERDRADVLNGRLARVSASSAELVAELELKNDELDRANHELALANARASELVVEIQLKNERIESLNVAVSRANAHASELVSELELKTVELQDALDHVRTLQGIIPICMHCHDIRSDKASWQRIEQYIQEHSGAKFSHSLCPDCAERYYPDDGGDDSADDADAARPNSAGQIRAARRR